MRSNGPSSVYEAPPLGHAGRSVVVAPYAGILLVAPVACALSGGWSWWWLRGVPVDYGREFGLAAWIGGLFGVFFGGAWGWFVGRAGDRGIRWGALAGASLGAGPVFLVTAAWWPFSAFDAAPCAMVFGAICGAGVGVVRRVRWAGYAAPVLAAAAGDAFWYAVACSP